MSDLTESRRRRSYTMAIEINKQEFVSRLMTVFSENGLLNLLDDERCELFYRLTERMLTENEKYNLTAITDVNKIILGHYADCAAIEGSFKDGGRVVDVGCGAGFPTLPLAIVRPDLQITAIDSTAKRVGYVAETAKMLGLSNISTRVIRAEDAGRTEELRESFDYATARAVAELRVLCELCLPLVKTGGKMVAMKGRNAELELQGARDAIAKLGGKGGSFDSITLRDADEELTHPLILIDKMSKTPRSYPRAYSQISKKPL